MEQTTGAVILINAFEVPPDADEPFIAGWERARAVLSVMERSSAPSLHRALRREAEFRFVDIGRAASLDGWREALTDPLLPEPDAAFPAHPGAYEIVHEDGTPDGTEGVLLVNPFEVPAGEDEQFLEGWRVARELLAARPGYLGTRLHRSLVPADFRFVNIARWSSPLAFANALQQPEAREAAAAIPFRSHPALYLVVRR
jgi:heme oxygenase (mycobilin-producing)